MTPAEHAAAFYGDDFAEVVAQHMQRGYVFAGPDFFVLGRAVPLGVEDSIILDFGHTFRREQCNAWLVTYFAGDLLAGLRLFPYSLPYIIFARDNGKLRHYKVESLTRIVHGIQTQRPNEAATAGGSASASAFEKAAQGFAEAG
jgi:hypothetical protein